MPFSPKKQLREFLAEDIGRRDITSEILPRKKIRARIISRQDAMVAGVRHAKSIFEIKGCRVRILKKDGSRIKPNQTILQVYGIAKNIFSCERTALNLLSRMSGIATQTNRLVKKIQNSKTKIYATRKTAPGLRFFDKEAVRIGGGEKHRMSLDEMVMIKDNHLAVAGSITDFVKRAKKKHSQVEVEVDNTKDAIKAAKAGASIILLDNFSANQISKTIRKLKQLRLGNKVRLEASGGINEKNIVKFAKSGVDMISVGQITNSVKGVDLSLEV